MRTTAWMFASMLVLTLLPATAAQEGPTPEELLRERLEELFGLDPYDPQPASGFCKPGAGCLPLYVDEDGDTMTGPLRMLDDILLEASLELPLPAQQSGSGILSILNGSFVRYDLAELNMPIDFTNELQLLDGAVLNATTGGTVFIDHGGNLSFADGSWFRPGLAHWFANMTFNASVFIRGAGNHLFVTDGATLVTDNQSGLLTRNGIGRIGTLDFNPLHLIVNNTTAFLLVPGTSPNLIGGHPDNQAANGTIGVLIAGGGAKGLAHDATADFVAILGGANNTAHGTYATVLGGRHNDAVGTGSLAAGQHATAQHNGTFVWADGEGTDFVSTATDQFLVRAQNGVGINTATPHSALTVQGDITPATDDTYALGSPTHRWAQLYMASEIDYATDLLYSSGGNVRATLTTAGDLQITGRFIGDGSGLTGVTASDLNDASVATSTLQDAAVTSPKIASGAVGTTQLAGSAVTDAKIQDGSVTTPKIADGAVTGPKLADGAVTAAKIGAACNESQVLKHQNGSWACADDEGVDSLSWTAITETPAGFADDVDNDTTYTAGDGIVLSGAMFSLLGCQPGELLKVNVDGTWACAGDADSGGDVTGVSAGNGLTGGGTSGDLTLAVDTTAIQSRVTGSCALFDALHGASIASIGSDGTVVCDVDDDTTYKNGAGLDLAGTTFAVNTTAIQTRVASSCVEGSSIRAIASDGTVACEPDTDTDTTYTAGTGLALAGTEFSADTSVLQSRISSSCAEGSAIRTVGATGDVTCQSTGAAETLDGLDSTQFLRSDTTDTYEGDELTIAPGSRLNVTGTLKSDLIPDLNDAYMLGNETNRYSDLWLASAIHYASPLVFESGGQTRMTLHPDGDLHVDGQLVAPNGLTSGAIDSEDIRVGSASSTDDDTVWFDDGASEYLQWSEQNSRFELSDDLLVPDHLRLDATGNAHLHYGATGETGQASGWDPNPSASEQGVFIEGGTGESSGLYLDGDVLSMWSPGDLDLLRLYDEDFLPSGGPAFAVDPDGDIRVGDSDGASDDTVFFDQAAESVAWRETDQQFTVSDDLSIAGALQTGIMGPHPGYNRFGGGTPTSGDIANSGDVGVLNDIEVGGQLYLSRDLYMETAGTDGDQNIWFYNAGNRHAESIRWDDSEDEFHISDQVQLLAIKMAGRILAESAGQLTWDGQTVCTSIGNCGGATVRLVAPNDIRLGSISESSTGSPGSLAGATGPDVTPILTGLGAASMCFLDADSDTAYDIGEPLYLNVDADTCTGEAVEAGDLRLTASGGHAAFSRVSVFHSDFNSALTDGNTGVDDGLEDGGSEIDFYDADGDGFLGAGDCVYADIDASGTTSVGDLRWTGCGSFAAGSVVSFGNTDVNLGLFGGGLGAFDLDTAASYWDSRPNGFLDSNNDVLYIDISEG